VNIERYNDRGFLSDVVAHGDLVWISGTVPNPDCHTIEEQTSDVLAEIGRRLKVAGSAKDKLVSVSIWLTDMNDWAAMNSVWTVWLDGAPSPARAVVGAALMAPFKVEIAATALRDRQG
jgi:enamine deaminase RidA (YjgF/YER057c/UK114 family)